MDAKREKAKKNIFSYWIVLIVDVLAFIGLGFLVWLLIRRIIDDKAITWEVTSIIATIALLMTTRSYWLTGKIKYFQCQKEQISYWEEKHPEYAELKNQIAEKKKELSELLLELRRKYGQTILLVTHDKELAQMADRVIEIKDGVIES